MNRKLFDDLPEVDGFDRAAFIKKVMDENGKDIETAKGKYDGLQSQLDNAKATIAELEKNAADADALNREIEKYKQAEAQRLADEAKQKQETELTERFDKVVNGKEFLNDFTRNGIREEFKKALELDENRGKGDGEIYDALIKDRDLFKNPQTARDIPGAGQYRNSSSDAQRMNELYKNNPFYKE